MSALKTHIASSTAQPEAVTELKHLFRAAHEFPQSYASVLAQVRSSPDFYLPATIILATKDGTSSGVIAIRVLEDLVSPEMDPELLLIIYQSLPHKTAILAQVALRAVQLVYKHWFSKGPALEAGDIMILNNLSERLNDAGEQASALNAAEKAVAACRLSPPGVNAQRLLTRCLNTLTKRQAESGVESVALEAAREAVEIANSLRNSLEEEDILYAVQANTSLSNRFHNLGRFQEALENAKHACQGIEALSNPEVHFAYDFALAQHVMANALTGLGRDAASLPHAEKADKIFRRLNPSAPDFYLDYQAAVAITYSQNLAHTGQTRPAYNIAQQAIERVQPLAAKYPLRYGKDFIICLLNGADSAYDLGEHGQALDWAKKAAAEMKIFNKRQGSHDPFLEGQIANFLFNCYFGMGEYPKAIGQARISVKCFCQGSGDGKANILELARSYRNLAEVQRVTAKPGKTNSAIKTARQAVELIDRQKDVSEAAALINAFCLSTEAACLHDAGRFDEAVIVENRSLQIRLVLCKDSGPHHEKHVAASRAALGLNLLAAGKPKEACEMARLAVDYYFQKFHHGSLEMGGPLARVMLTLVDCNSQLELFETVFSNLENGISLFRPKFDQSPEIWLQDILPLATRYLQLGEKQGYAYQLSLVEPIIQTGMKLYNLSVSA